MQYLAEASTMHFARMVVVTQSVKNSNTTRRPIECLVNDLYRFFLLFFPLHVKSSHTTQTHTIGWIKSRFPLLCSVFFRLLAIRCSISGPSTFAPEVRVCFRFFFFPSSRSSQVLLLAVAVWLNQRSHQRSTKIKYPREKKAGTLYLRALFLTLPVSNVKCHLE